MKKNVVVIGAGINGLVVSNYLQKNDFQVLLIEKNDHVGGACVKDSINYNNEKILYPKGATVLGMMQKFIFNETGLSNHVETFYPKTPKLVYFPGDKDPTRIFQDIKDLEIELKAKWNEDGDVEGFRNDENKVIDFIQNLYRNGDSPNVEKATETLGNKLTHLWIKGSAYDLLNNYFNSEKTKLYMGMTVTESGPASIYDEGTAFTIPLMDSGSIFNGYWGFVKQGIWEITEKLDSINRALGVDAILSANITRIDTDKKKIYLKNKVIEFDILVFATDPKTPSLLLNEDNSYNKILDKEFIGTSGKVTAFFKNPVIWKNNQNKTIKIKTMTLLLDFYFLILL